MQERSNQGYSDLHVAWYAPAAPVVATSKPEPMTNPATTPQDAVPALASVDFRAPELYLNHELSALEFNFRVLAQARAASVPLLERLHFLCISVRNLDEFFEVRVASLKHWIAYGDARPGPDGLPLSEVLAQVRENAIRLVQAQYETWNDELRPAMAREGIVFSDSTQWSPVQTRWAREHFEREILPVLSPLGLNSAHPFPRILNKSLNVAVVLHGEDAFAREGNVAVVRAPRSLPRVIRMPPEVADAPYQFVFLSTLLEQIRRRDVPRHGDPRCLPVPRHARFRAGTRRRRHRESGAGIEPGIARTRLCRSGTARTWRELHARDKTDAAGQFRPDRRRRVSVRRPGQSASRVERSTTWSIARS